MPHAAMLASHLGGSLLGLRVRDARRLIDHLATCPEFDLGRLGVMGLSGGGMLAFFTSCLDVRIAACVVSGYYSTFTDSVHAMQHCACNYVHGLHDFGEMYDLVGLVAPRPLFVEAGTHDPLFPIEAVTRGVARPARCTACSAPKSSCAPGFSRGVIASTDPRRRPSCGQYCSVDVQHDGEKSG